MCLNDELSQFVFPFRTLSQIIILSFEANGSWCFVMIYFYFKLFLRL